jgi:hypothetical protein
MGRNDVGAFVDRMCANPHSVFAEIGFAPFSDLALARRLLSGDAAFHRININHDFPPFARQKQMFDEIALDFDLIHGPILHLRRRLASTVAPSQLPHSSKGWASVHLYTSAAPNLSSPNTEHLRFAQAGRIYASVSRARSLSFDRFVAKLSSRGSAERTELS